MVPRLADLCSSQWLIFVLDCVACAIAAYQGRCDPKLQHGFCNKVHMLIHQRTFTKQLLSKHGLDRMSKPITAIQMGSPEENELPPSSAQLKELHAYASEFNWLATRARSDLAYHVSVIASAAAKYPLRPQRP